MKKVIYFIFLATLFSCQKNEPIKKVRMYEILYVFNCPSDFDYSYTRYIRENRFGDLLFETVTGDASSNYSIKSFGREGTYIVEATSAADTVVIEVYIDGALLHHNKKYQTAKIQFVLK